MVLAPWCFLPAALTAQTVQNDFGQSGLYYGVEQLKVVAGKVITAKGDGVPHAWIQIVNNAGAPVRTIQTDNRGVFQTDYNFRENSDEVKHFTVTLTVTKKGFEVAHKIQEIPTSKVLPIGITLRPIKPADPTLLSEADLIKGVAPKLRQLRLSDGVPPKEAKEYERGAQDFLDRNHVEQAVPRFEKVARSNPQCLRCRTMLALAELTWGDWDDARREVGESVNAYLAKRTLGTYEPLFVHGVLASWDGDPERAEAYIAEAAKFAPDDPVVLQELGRVQCMDLDWVDASESLRKALAAGAGPDVRLMHAEALAWAGTPSEAEAELNLYLNGRDPKNMPPRVKSIWANIQARKKDQAALVVVSAKAKGRGEDPIDYIHHPPTRNLPDFLPATDQAALPGILASVGKNVADLFANVPNICSLEDVHQERLARNGKTASAKEYKYRYLLTMPDQHWGPSVDEFRADLHGNATPPLGSSDGFMLTSGFTSAPLVFHPAYQNGSTFRLLGRQKLNGRDTFVVAYAQEPARSRIYGSFQEGKIVSVTFKQGMAWIDAENYQIVRLTSDLLKPAPLVRLDKETTEIDFSEVKFKKVPQKFWLPDEVKVTLDWNGRVLRNQHAYSDFLLSNVDATQKIEKPKDAEKTTEEEDPLTPPVPPASPSLSLAPPIPKP
jgi:Flp pilus assembly protein TadD